MFSPSISVLIVLFDFEATSSPICFIYFNLPFSSNTAAYNATCKNKMMQNAYKNVERSRHEGQKEN